MLSDFSCHNLILCVATGPQVKNKAKTPDTFRQRYCYPSGCRQEYSDKGATLWTRYIADGKEDPTYRILNVYLSQKRSAKKKKVSGAHKKEAVSKYSLVPFRMSIPTGRFFFSSTRLQQLPRNGWEKHDSLDPIHRYDVIPQQAPIQEFRGASSQEGQFSHVISRQSQSGISHKLHVNIGHENLSNHFRSVSYYISS